MAYPAPGFIRGVSVIAVCLKYNRPTIKLDFIRKFKTHKTGRFIVILISVCTYVKGVVKGFYSVQYLITLRIEAKYQHSCMFSPIAAILDLLCSL